MNQAGTGQSANIQDGVFPIGRPLLENLPPTYTWYYTYIWLK